MNEPWKVSYTIVRWDKDDIDPKTGKLPPGKKFGDEQHRFVNAIGPITIEHNHWAGNYLEIEPTEAEKVVALWNRRMTEARAREVLAPHLSQNGGKLSDGYIFQMSYPDLEVVTVDIDGTFTVDELEAIAWWMRNEGVKS